MTGIAKSFSPTNDAFYGNREARSKTGKPVKPLVHGHLAAVTLLALAACTPAPPDGGMNDPFEATNRAVHQFNKDVDRAILRPAGQAAAALPEAIRIPVVNFSNNADLPGMVLNNVLQGDVGGAVQNTMRFIINSTVGVLGLADPAGAIGLTEVETDFGQTLAVWGVPEGAYVELPLLGPSTERDAVGTIVDFALDPLGEVGLNRLGNGAMDRYDIGAWVAEQVIDRGTFGGTVDSVLYESADSYAQTRLLYLQNRRFELGESGQGGYLDPYADGSAADEIYIDPYEASQ
jgi:phospholipid-binding lipoprotein MlaA